MDDEPGCAIAHWASRAREIESDSTRDSTATMICCKLASPGE
jgi:hypothetical protein